ncbi:MAG TPA: indolepyruvate oxidoreductase subunit beta [Ruminococcaceae bacterium]|nr:indolepyruvate oxidoreductase subunit beta [Oscillospiraceae bacterium]
MSQTKSIMIVGVGGQGSLLASKLFGNVLLARGYDVKVSEVHGMSQRGGSVVTYVKYGDKVYSPVVEQGEADVIISFEKLEAARWVSYLKKGGKMIVSEQQIDPMPVIIGAASYPENIIDKIKDMGIQITSVDALSIAEKLGNAKAANVVLMGVVSAMLDISVEDWRNAIKECVPEKFLELNLAAFESGRKLV